MTKGDLEKAGDQSGSTVKEDYRDVVDAKDQACSGLQFDPDIDYAAASTYNIYHRKEGKEHFIITPVTSQYRERCNPRKKEKPSDIFRNLQDLPLEVQGNSFFVHKPYVSFHHTPRTLRRGPTKESPAVCLVQNSWFWRRWGLQFGEKLRHAVDPRGVIPEEYASDSIGNSRIGDSQTTKLKGYKVRSWRLWGESGKDYHRKVNADRKAGTSSDEARLFKPLKQPLVDEEVHFWWHSPFTHKTRHYNFTYAGLEFYWKGTGTVKESRTCGFWLRFHHVKLCVRVPIVATFDSANGNAPVKRTVTRGSFLSRFSSKNAGFREVCLAKYTSSLAATKAGTLDIYDDVLHRLMVEGVIPVADEGTRRELEEAGPVGVKGFRLYEVIVATAMCMVIAEWQKRMLLLVLIELGGSAGG